MTCVMQCRGGYSLLLFSMNTFIVNVWKNSFVSDTLRVEHVYTVDKLWAGYGTPATSSYEHSHSKHMQEEELKSLHRTEKVSQAVNIEFYQIFWRCFQIN